MYNLELSLSFDLELADDEQFLRDLQTANVRLVAPSLCRTWRASYEEQEESLSHLAERMDKVAKICRFHYVHISFGNLWCLCKVDEAARLFAVQRTLDVCRRVAKYGVEYIVVHTNGVDFSGPDRAGSLQALRRSLIDLAKGSPIPIAVENLPRTCLGNSLQEMQAIMEDMPENVKFVFDVNHVFMDAIPDFVRGMRDRLAALHVSDCDGVEEKHWLPGLGVIDWQAFIGALEEVGYRGAFNYEMQMTSSTQTPVIGANGVPVQYTPQEVADNYKALFAKYNEGR